MAVGDSSHAEFFAVLPARGDCPPGNMHFHLNACFAFNVTAKVVSWLHTVPVGSARMKTI